MKKTLVAILALGGMAMAEDITDSALKTIIEDSKAPVAKFDVSDLTESQDFSYTFSLNEEGVKLIKSYVGSNKSVGSPTLVSMVGNVSGQMFGVGMGYSTDAATRQIIEKAAPFMAICGAGTDVGTTGYRLATDATNYWMWQNSDALDATTFLQGVSFTLSSSKSDGATLYTTLAYGPDKDTLYYYSVIPGVGENPKANMFDSGLKWSTFHMSELQVNTNYVDKVLVYGSALSSDAALASNKAIFALVPEPATATLSLLALAGLAARRRRH